MAQIKATDIINGEEVSEEVQKVVKSFNELMKQLGSLSVQYQKSTGSSKELTDAEKESARIAKEEAKAQKDIENAQKSLQSQRQRGLAAMAKEEAKKRELIATSKQEVTTLRSAEQKLKAMKEVYRSMPQGTEEARKSAEQYRLEIQRLDAAVKKGGAGIGEYNRNVGNYPKGMGQATKSTGGFTKGLAAMAVGIMAAIAVVRRLSKYVTDTIMTFAKFDYVQAQVKAISGATAEEMDALRNTAKELGATTEKTAQEVSQLQLNLSKLGFTATEINAATDAIVKLSIAAGEDLTRSAEVMAGVMNAFALPATEAARVADVMAASFSGSALNLEKFQYSMSSVAPVANELGYSIEEITGLMAVLADSNVDAGTASAQVRNILLELNKSGLTLAEGLEMLNGSTDKMNLANDMFGKRAAPIAVILSNNVDKADELTKSFENSAGAADKMAAMMADTLEGDMKKAQSSMEALKISLGEGQNDGLRGIIQGFAKAIDTLTASGVLTEYLDMLKEQAMMIFKPFQNLFKLFGEGGDAADGLATAFRVYMKVMQVIQTPIRQVWAFFDMLTGVIVEVVDALKNWKDINFQDVLNILNRALVKLIEPFSDLVGMTDKVKKFFGVQREEITLTAEEYAKLNVLSGNYLQNVRDLVKEKIETNKLIEETTALLIEEEEATNAVNEAYQKYLETIKGINDEYGLMIQFLKSDSDIKQAAIDRDKKLFDASLDYYKKVTPEMQKMIDSYSIITVEAEKLNKIGGLNIVNEQDIELIKTTTEEAKSYLQTMVDIANSFDVSTLKSQTFFEKMSEAAGKFGEFWEQNGEAIKMTIGAIGDAVNQHYENQIGLLETQQEKTDAYWDRQIERYKGDEAAQAQLEQAKAKAAEETQRKIIDARRKKAIFDKAQAIVDIAINTAVGIMAALASIPPNPILATAIGINGAVQAGIVASQPLPQYKIGLDSAKEDHIGIVGDAGAELVHYPDGSSALFSKPTATFLPKFSIVDTAQETQAKLKSMEFQNNMYKFTANNDKQVKLLSTIAKNTGKNGMRDQDIFFIKRYAK